MISLEKLIEQSANERVPFAIALNVSGTFYQGFLGSFEEGKERAIWQLARLYVETQPTDDAPLPLIGKRREEAKKSRVENLKQEAREWATRWVEDGMEGSSSPVVNLLDYRVLYSNGTLVSGALIQIPLANIDSWTFGHREIKAPESNNGGVFMGGFIPIPLNLFN